MLIGILQCGHAPDPVQENHGDFDVMFPALLDGQGFTFKTWNVVDGDFPAGATDADGWLLTGSKHGAYDDLPFIDPLEALIREIYASARPMVGVCFGHQIIAQALGGKVAKFDGGWAIGRQDYATGNHGSISLNAWHQDQVVERPKDAQVIATNEFCENAALVYGDRAYTIQPHPELNNAIIADYIDARRGTGSYPDALMDRAALLTQQPTQDATIAQDFADFFRGTFTPQVLS